MSRPPETINCLGILAGRGTLPRQVAAACAARQQPVFVIDLEGLAGDWAGDYPGTRVSLGQVGKALAALRGAGCDAVTMAGGLARPSFAEMRLDWTGTRLLPRLLRHARAGDNALLREVATLFEEHGFRVIGPDRFLTDALAPSGRIAGAHPTGDALAEIAVGRRLLHALSPFDVGQAVVISAERCLAIEAAEGTAEMLRRVRTAPGATGGVLVKAPKQGQERRVDLPAIGPETVHAAHAAGLRGIAVAAQGVLILERAECIRVADRAKLFLYGFDPDAA